MNKHNDGSVFITGASGFIGNRVAKILHDQGYNITALSRHGAIAALPGIETVSSAEDCHAADYIIHIAHDHFVSKANKQLWEKLESLADRVGTRGIVLFSSVSVHAPEFRGVLTEADPYARHGDDYVATKIWLEESTKAWADRKPGTSAWILRPTIVVGRGGNWTNHGLDVAGKNHAYLPFGGKNPCCAVHVDDVAQATLSAMENLSEFSGARASIVSGPTTLTWEDFYVVHTKLYELNAGKKSTLSIDEIHDNKKYHASSAKNLMYWMLFDSILSSKLRPLLGGARQWVRKKRARNQVAQEKPISDSWTPQGMGRIFHSGRFTVRHNLPNWTPNIPINGAVWIDHR